MKNIREYAERLREKYQFKQNMKTIKKTRNINDLDITIMLNSEVIGGYEILTTDKNACFELAAEIIIRAHEEHEKLHKNKKTLEIKEAQNENQS